MRRREFITGLAGSAAWPVVARGQPAPPPDPQQPAYTPGELVNAGHRFFGGIASGLASLIEKAVGQWGLPNGYVLGEEAGGAFFGGLRYGEGTLYTKNTGDLRVFWQGPTLGWDFGGEGARTMMLIYGLPATQAIHQRFAGISGSAYFVGGFGMTALTANDIVLVPIRSGVGFRLGANVGYLKFTPQPTLNPFCESVMAREWPGSPPRPSLRLHAEGFQFSPLSLGVHALQSG
jgi:hypothetical protein